MRNEFVDNIDIQKTRYLQEDECWQSDSLVWIIDLSINGVPITIGSGRSVVVNVIKPDNTYVIQTNNIAVVDSIATIKLAKQVNTVPGQVKLVFKILEGTGDTAEVITSVEKIITVKKALLDGAIPSQSVVTIVSDIDSAVTRGNACRDSINTAIDNGDLAKMKQDISKNTSDILTKFDKDRGEATANLATYLNTQVYDAMEGAGSLVANMQKKAKQVDLNATNVKVNALEAKNVTNTLINSNKTSVTVFPKAVVLNNKTYDKLLITGSVSHADISGGTCTQEPVGNVTWCCRTRPVTLPIKLSVDIMPQIFAETTYLFWDLNARLDINAIDITANFLLKTTSVASANDADASKYVHYLIVGYRESI